MRQLLTVSYQGRRTSRMAAPFLDPEGLEIERKQSFHLEVCSKKCHQDRVRATK